MREKQYFPDEESGNAGIVREIFAMYANGAKQREIAIMLGQRGVRTKSGKLPENRWIDYILRNPCYIGKIRLSLDGERAVSKRDYDNDKIMVADGQHEPLVSLELWEKVQKMLDEQKARYPKYAKRNQVIPYMLKGLVRCSSCGGTLAMSSSLSGKSKTRTLQCCNYSRGKCHTSHSVTLPKIEEAFKAGLRQALGEKQFTIVPKQPKKSEQPRIDFDKLIEVEERKLVRAREAYLAEIDTLEQYSKNKAEITKRIEDLKAKRDDVTFEEVDMNAFTKKVAAVADFIGRDDVSEEAKSEMLHTIIEKTVYDKAKGNLAIYFSNL